MRVELREMTEPATWADPTPVPAPFGGGWPITVRKLETELGHLDVATVVVEVTGPKVEIRRDGWPSARSVLDHPIIVSFEAPSLGPLQYRSGRYRFWHSNVHAVALTLERLRAIDRYGCAPTGQQYTGWAALPPAETQRSPAHVVCVLAGIHPADLVGPVTKTMYRRALFAAHPDHGGTRETFEEVQQAGRALGLA